MNQLISSQWFASLGCLFFIFFILLFSYFRDWCNINKYQSIECRTGNGTDWCVFRISVTFHIFLSVLKHKNWNPFFLGSAVAYKVDQRIHRTQSKIIHSPLGRKCACYTRFISKISVELRRTYLVYLLLMGIIFICAAIFNKIQDNWNYVDSLYFMWISISTIGYGDLEPDVIQNQLWFGLATTGLFVLCNSDPILFSVDEQLVINFAFEGTGIGI